MENPAGELHEVLSSLVTYWGYAKQEEIGGFPALALLALGLSGVHNPMATLERSSLNSQPITDVIRTRSVRRVVAFSELPEATMRMMRSVSQLQRDEYMQPMRALDQHLRSWPYLDVAKFMDGLDANTLTWVKVIRDVLQVRIEALTGPAGQIPPSQDIEGLIAGLLEVRASTLRASLPSDLAGWVDHTVDRLVDALSTYQRNGDYGPLLLATEETLVGLQDAGEAVANLDPASNGRWRQFIDRVKDVIVLTTFISQLAALPGQIDGALDAIAGIATPKELAAGEAVPEGAGDAPDGADEP